MVRLPPTVGSADGAPPEGDVSGDPAALAVGRGVTLADGLDDVAPPPHAAAARATATGKARAARSGRERDARRTEDDLSNGGSGRWQPHRKAAVVAWSTDPVAVDQGRLSQPTEACSQRAAA